MQVQELLNTDLYAAAVQAIRDHIVGKHTSDQASGEAIQLELIITSSYLSHSIYQRYNKGTWSKTKHSIPPTYSGAKKKENHIIELAILTEKKSGNTLYWSLSIHKIMRQTRINMLSVTNALLEKTDIMAELILNL